MKKTIFSVLGLMALVVYLSGCYKDVLSPDLEYAPQNVSFNNDLVPLFKTHCTDVGCHVNGGHVPYMDDETKTFKSIVSGNYVNTTFPKSSKLYQFVYGEMAQYTTSAERLKIYDWIRNGAKNN